MELQPQSTDIQNQTSLGYKLALKKGKNGSSIFSVFILGGKHDICRGCLKKLEIQYFCYICSPLCGMSPQGIFEAESWRINSFWCTSKAPFKTKMLPKCSSTEFLPQILDYIYILPFFHHGTEGGGYGASMCFLIWVLARLAWLQQDGCFMCLWTTLFCLPGGTVKLGINLG